MASPLAPRPVSPSIYAQSHASDSTTKSTKSQNSGHTLADPPLSGPRSRRNFFLLPLLHSSSRIGLRAINSDLKVQQHQHPPKQPGLTTDPVPDARASQHGTMEHSLTPQSSRSTFQRKCPPGSSLLGSPSTPNLGSYSTPDLRQLGEKKSTRRSFFKGGFKNLFRRGAPKSGVRGVDISSPLGHQATRNDTDEDEDPVSFDEMLADKEHENCVMGKMSDMTISSPVGVAPPSPLMPEQDENQTETKAEDKIEEEDDGMTPHEREALRLGLELDFSCPDPLLESANMVRAYKDLGSDFYATRDAGPIYDGSAVNSDNANTPQDQPDSIGTWKCCKCDSKQELYKHDQEQHLISTLNCVCSHKSCENCTLTGSIKLYQPVQEPIPVQLSDDANKQVNFGVFCSNCGLSWRAQIVKDTTLVQKISAVPKDLAKRSAHPLEKLRDARSMSNLRGELSTKISSIPTKSTLNLRQLSNEMEKEHGKQANSVMVEFSGIQCSCGGVVDSASLCFQIVEPTKVEEAAPEPVGMEPGFTATREDQAKGIGRSTLTLKDKRVRHANPLMSNPVTAEDLDMMAMFK